MSGSSSTSRVDLEDNNEKYKGLIDVPLYKQTEDALFELFDYSVQVTPPMYLLHSIVAFFRMLQFLGPSICSRFDNIWGTETVMGKTMNILGIFYHFVPGTLRDNITVYVLLAYVAFSFICIICIFGAAYVYKKTATLPRVVSILIIIFFSTIGYLGPPAMINLAGELVGSMISETAKMSFTINMITIVLFVLIIAVFFYIYANIYIVSIVFKPDSFMSVLPTVQRNLMFVIIIVTLLTSLASKLTVLAAKETLLCITLLTYAGSVKILFSHGGLVKIIETKMVGAAAVAGSILSTIAVAFEPTPSHADEILFVVVISVFFISFASFNFIIDRRVTNQLNRLDEIMEEPELFDEYIRSPNMFADYVVNGFRYGHPYVTNFDIFSHAIELWPDNLSVWIIYAKFTAIYPERSTQLSQILNSIQVNKIKSGLAKHIMFQIHSVLMQRETNFIPKIKQKLDRIKKEVNSCKAKVRNVWDQVIQGNVSELETALITSKNTTTNCHTDFMHLIRTFPNSRFVTRQYSRFLRDVVGDIDGYKEWSENTKRLQKGIAVLPDKSHDMGLMAFPEIPKVNGDGITNNVSMTSGGFMVTDETITIEIEEELDENVGDNVRQSIKEGIDRLVIPSYRKTKYLYALSFLVFILIPGLFFLLYSNVYTTNITLSLSFMQEVCLIRSNLGIGASLSMHYVLEKKGFINESFNSYYGDLEYLGNSKNTNEQLSFIVLDTAELVEELSKYLSWEPYNDNADAARDLLYVPDLEYKFYPDDTGVPTVDTISLLNSVSEFIILFEKLATDDSLDFTTIENTKYILELEENIELMFDTILEVYDNLYEYVQSSRDNFYNVIVICIPLFIVLDLAIFLPLGLYTTISIKREKTMIYNMLVSLPKNVVSQISDGLKMINKNSDDIDDHSHTTDNSDGINKQEDNLLKIFMMTGTIRQKSLDIMVLWLATIIFMIMFALYTVCSITYFYLQQKALANNAPQINLLTRYQAFDILSVALIMFMSTANSGMDLTSIDVDQTLAFAIECQEKDIASFSLALFGNLSENVYPFDAITDYIGYTTNPYQSNCESDTDVPDNIHEVFRCFPSDLLVLYIHMRSNSYYRKYVLDSSEYSFDIDTDVFNDVWYIILQYIYCQFIRPIFDNIITVTTATALESKPLMLFTVIIAMAVGFIAVVVVFIFMVKGEDVQKYALKLLLMVPESYLTMNSSLSSILAGNFSASKGSSTNRNESFYRQVISELPDCVFIVDSSGVIRSANNATKHVYGIEPQQVLGEKIVKFGEIYKGKNPFEGIDYKKRVEIEEDLTIERDGAESHINISYVSVAGSYILTSRNITQTVMYNKLIADERAKSDAMLASILPAKLVPRVQAGEKNISFSVQTASVLFLDVVSFTPWCGANEAKYIMSTLNRMFKDFDAILATHPTMTKIKCIGDCYMAAAGIFAEVNQPAVHAKDITEFGLDVIDALEKINKEIGETLRIRVGINTGGPLVAGVIGNGTGKPTFEILGPTINMAQQMEHHGVPMAVHVSRATYELIYGGNFDIKERGEVEVKQGKVQTYIVSRKK